MSSVSLSNKETNSDDIKQQAGDDGLQLTQLPDDILYEIIKRLNFQDIAIVGETCRRLKTLIENYKTLYKAEYRHQEEMDLIERFAYNDKDEDDIELYDYGDEDEYSDTELGIINDDFFEKLSLGSNYDDGELDPNYDDFDVD